MTSRGTVGTAPSETFDLDAVSIASRRLRDEWNQLASECRGSSYFQTADWVWSWWETVARNAPTRIACWRAPDGKLEAVAAVSDGRVLLHRRLDLTVPALTLAGTGPGDADHCGPLARPDRRADVADWLRGCAGRRSLVAEAIDSESGIAPRGARFVEHNPCPRLAIDPADHRVGRSANFRAQLGRFSRRIARAGVSFEWQAAGSVEPRAVMDLFELHWRLRRSRGQATTLERQHRELMLRCVERSAVDRGPAAVIARKGVDVVGVLVGYSWQGSFSAYQKGWDPAYAEFSMGSLLVAEAIRQSAGGGAHTFDFLRGTEEYKYRFGAVDHDDQTVVVAAGPVGALFRARALALTTRAARDARARATPSSVRRPTREPAAR